MVLLSKGTFLTMVNAKAQIKRLHLLHLFVNTYQHT